MSTRDSGVSSRTTRSKLEPVFTENQSAFALNDLGLTAAKEGDHRHAADCFRKAISESAGHAFIFSNYALTLRDLGQFTEAIQKLKVAISLDPENSVFFFNLGNIQFEVGLVREAMASYELALRGKAGFPELLCNYALVALGEKEIALAQRLARRGLMECPPSHPLHVRFAIALSSIESSLGNKAAALARLEELLDGPSSKEVLCEYIRILSTAAFKDITEKSLLHISSIFENRWSAPEQIAYAAWRRIIEDRGLPEAPMVKPWPELALILLSSTIIPDVDMECWLSRQRRHLLNLNNDAQLSDHDVAFFIALAQQCFHRNYLLEDTDSGQSDIEGLRKNLDDHSEDNTYPNILQILKYACCDPLANVKNAQRLLAMSDEVPRLRPLFHQQIENPLREKALEPSIRRLFSAEAIQDDVNARYSAHPYPQWTWPGQLNTPELFNVYLVQRLAHSNFDPMDDTRRIRILIAGCGTGRHSHIVGCMVANSQITAIDISRRSLAFAKRQAIDHNLTNVEYIDADIMSLNQWTERFDVIECAGVLHHLPDPDAGLSNLLSLLRPNGMILIGLYSRRARKPMIELRARIEPFLKTDIINALHHARRIVKSDPAFKSLLEFQEFYSLNGCLDLILHPREVSYDPVQIKSILEQHGLIFRGFELTDDQKSSFRMRNRRPEDLLNLLMWDEHEHEHPDLFMGMYQFWAQKQPE